MIFFFKISSLDSSKFLWTIVNAVVLFICFIIIVRLLNVRGHSVFSINKYVCTLTVTVQNKTTENCLQVRMIGIRTDTSL